MSTTAVDREVRVEDMPGLAVPEALKLGQHQLEALIAELKGLASEDWEKPTDCDRWMVRDIVAHVVGWAEAIPSPAEMMRLSKAARSLRKELDMKLDAQNEAQVIARRHMSPDRLVEALEASKDKFMRTRRIAARAGGPVPLYNGAIGWTTVRFLAAQIFTRDHLMHRIDISRAAGRELELGPSEKRIVDDIVRQWGRSSKADALLRLSGPAGGNFVSGAGGRATIAGDALDFCRILAGREGASAMEIEGDRVAAEKWLAAPVPF